MISAYILNRKNKEKRNVNIKLGILAFRKLRNQRKGEKEEYYKTIIVFKAYETQLITLHRRLFKLMGSRII